MNQDAKIQLVCWIVITVCAVLALKLKFGLLGKSRKFYAMGLFVYLVPWPLVILSEIYDSNLLMLIAISTSVPAFFFVRYLIGYLYPEGNEK
jgi:hypothetical protein